jgi:molybdopterin converting factor small subunit
MITVRLPAMLRNEGPDTVTVTEPVSSVAALVEVLTRRIPGLSEKLDDAVLNFAVNDELILHDVLRTPLKDGDTVELVPTISGGSWQPASPRSAEDAGS